MTLLLRTLVAPYYTRNAGFLGVVVYLAFGFMRPQDHHALMAAILTSPFLLALTASLWGLYTLRATVFTRQLLSEPPQRFLLSARLLPRSTRWAGWVLVSAALLLPVEAYAGWMLQRGFVHQTWAANAALTGVVLLLVSASAYGLDERVRNPYPERALRLPRWRWSIPYVLFYPSFLLRHRPVATLLSKAASVGLLIGVCRLYPTDDYDQRLLLIGLMMSLVAHAPLCRLFFEFEQTWLRLLPNLPISPWGRLGRYVLAYTVLWLPELPVLLYNAPVRVSPVYMGTLWFTGLGWLLFFHTFAYRPRWNPDRWQQQVLGGFLAGLLLIMFGIPALGWLAIALCLTGWQFVKTTPWLRNTHPA
ncbi:hypothetical protein [Rudanella paleaurantiibacter]|uniref:hypothetical protein n=1 Tax=Rudanella paleaurantiibacter TaxID=2614655 RepID=UPI0016288604|nr:hypothetical protein [Rudanella paleaurantiibacter]